MKKIILILIIYHIGFIVTAQEFQFEKITTNVNSSFRGLSVVDDQVAWVSGSNGWVGTTSDGGRNWSFSQVSGFETVDFRTLYAFDGYTAIIANAGSPGNILITTNSGKDWKTVYSNTDPAAFFDGIDFWNENEGIIYGDPIDGQMLMLRTHDGGNTWTRVFNAPRLAEGEASFAASGTGIRCLGKNKVVISTGGMVSSLWISADKGESWRSNIPPIIQGEPTKGIYSFTASGKVLILVGGDYTKPELAEKHNLYSTNFGKTWLTPFRTTRGYRECVEFISKKTLLSTGPTGTDISVDKGKSWQPLSEEKGFHVVRKARKGSLVIMAGGQGQISILKN